MLENLVIAVESEATIVDIGRVSGFMQKVRQFLDFAPTSINFCLYIIGSRWYHLKSSFPSYLFVVVSGLPPSSYYLAPLRFGFPSYPCHLFVMHINILQYTQ